MRLGCEDRQVELAKALGVADRLDLDNPSASDREAENHHQSSPRGYDHSHDSVHQRWLSGPGTARNRPVGSGETDQRLFAVAAWRDAPYFTDAERAALALTEAVTRLSDRAVPVQDEIWDEAARHYDETGLAALVIAIATINVWNRLNVATRQVAGQWTD